MNAIVYVVTFDRHGAFMSGQRIAKGALGRFLHRAQAAGLRVEWHMIAGEAAQAA